MFLDLLVFYMVCNVFKSRFLNKTNVKHLLFLLSSALKMYIPQLVYCNFAGLPI